MNSPVPQAVTQHAGPELEARLPRRILLALDSSDHSNAATRSASEIGGLSVGAVITGAHVYAAKLHDQRFRQMEGGLPAQFREEQELERQREVHDDLITRGLSIITDSYLDQAEAECRRQGVEFRRCSLEGKNYSELTREANSGRYELLVMGALGLGAIQGSRIGTVCRRVARRARLDTLVIKETGRPLNQGPIVVALDGSARAYGGLLTALALARRWQVPVYAVAAFDPYYHYVAFNRIAGVLSEQAGKVFRFKEQEKLHEEIIDSGLARIYEGHLSVGRSIASGCGVTIQSELVAGKPHDAIGKYLRRVQPTLLIVGKTGVHADEALDIGGNSEHLLESVDCAVLLSTREHQPETELIAGVTTSWTREAEARMERVPSFVRNVARMAILRYAQDRGHTVITERIVEEATAQLMPGHARRAIGEIVAAHDAGELNRDPGAGDALRWSGEAVALLRTVPDLAIRGTLSMRAEKKARQEKAAQVEASHVRPFLDAGADGDGAGGAPNRQPGQEIHWQAAALARLMRVPEGFMRERSRLAIEDYATRHGHAEITLEVAEGGLAVARAEMERRMREQQAPGAPAADAGRTAGDHGGAGGSSSGPRDPRAS